MNPSATFLFPALLTAFAGCCGTTRPTLSAADYPGTLQPPTNLPIEAVWQQHVTASWQAPGERREERGFDAAVQRRGDTLTVLGLSPMGSVGFSIEQGPDGIAVANHMPEQLPIPPRFVLLDVQRTLFPWLPPGASEVERDGERITERRAGGRPIERTFERLDADPPGVIRITYSWDNPAWAVPTRAVLDNGWFGYRLTIDTHGETRLGPPANGADGR